MEKPHIVGKNITVLLRFALLQVCGKGESDAFSFLGFVILFSKFPLNKGRENWFVYIHREPGNNKSQLSALTSDN